ncbi:hypothetical protein, partial [Methylobacterium aerolatum]|uniref:hypothetical protein n=1 Tax=Methylobacterium aerolatum TaxID=418708 RepID=UPI001EDDA33D
GDLGSALQREFELDQLCGRRVESGASVEMNFDAHSPSCTGRFEAITKIVTKMSQPLVGDHEFCHELSSRRK